MAIKEHPILFSSDMVRAILEGRKTQTRRVVKVTQRNSWLVDDGWTDNYIKDPENHLVNECPYGQPGDRLWLRETFYPVTNTLCLYKADGDDIDPAYNLKWRPSIYMPRWASRITLEITGIRVERVQEITNEGAKAEGVELVPAFTAGNMSFSDVYGSHHYYHDTAREAFQELWDSINAKRGYSWDANPWVWVIEFKRTEES